MVGRLSYVAIVLITTMSVSPSTLGREDGPAALCFAVIVTRGVRAAGGAPVQAAEPFRRFRQTVRGEYEHALLEAMQVARHRGVRTRDIAVASVFTT